MSAELDFAKCTEVDAKRIATAFAPAKSLSDPQPREKVLALLERMAQVSAPNEGAGTALEIVARIARCNWLDGDLEVRLRGGRRVRDGKPVGEAVQIDLMVDDGLAVSRLRKPLTFKVPLTEFRDAIENGTHSLAPLSVVESDPKRMKLRSGEPPKMSEDSLAESLYSGKVSPGSEQAQATRRWAVPQLPPEAYREGDPRRKSARGFEAVSVEDAGGSEEGEEEG